MPAKIFAIVLALYMGYLARETIEGAVKGGLRSNNSVRKAIVNSMIGVALLFLTYIWLVPVSGFAWVLIIIFAINIWGSASDIGKETFLSPQVCIALASAQLLLALFTLWLFVF